MITIYAHDPELFPSAQSQNHTPHLSRELTVPLVSLTPEDQITFSGISDTKPNDNSCRKPHDSFAEGSCPLLYHISQWPRRIRGTSSPPYNPLGKACLHPRGEPRGTRQSVVIENGEKRTIFKLTKLIFLPYISYFSNLWHWVS